MKKLLLVMVLIPLMAIMSEVAVAGEPTVVTSVTARQHYPWNGLVDITVTLSGASNDAVRAACTFVASNSATRAALNVSHVTGGSIVSGSGSIWMRRFVWDAAADIGEVKIIGLELVVEVNSLGGVQLWENGPYWAERNVGATKPEEYGYYFWWGDTVGYYANTNSATLINGYYWQGVKWVSSKGDHVSGSPFNWSDCPTDNKTVSQLQSDGYIDSTGNLVASHDAATTHLGAPWRMPTDAECSTLINNCDIEWITRNGIWGQLVMGKGTYSSKRIFFPAAGTGSGYESALVSPGSSDSCWTSSPRDDSSHDAWALYSNSSHIGRGLCDRFSGLPVRPLRGFAAAGETISTAKTHLVLGCGATGGEVTAMALTAQQRYPWNGMVDIAVTLSGASNDVARADCTFVATNSVTHAALNVSHITGDNVVSGSGSTWTRRFVWDAATDVGEVKIEDVALAVVVKEFLGGVQLWEDGPYWAECNVGATKPEEYGYYFWWGDTVGYVHDGSKWVASDGSSIGFSFYNTDNENPVIATMWKDNATLKSEGWIGEDENLTAAHDAATALLGTPWRMPTDADFADLTLKCDWSWTTSNGVWGRLVTGRGAYSSKRIFLPAAGSGIGSDLNRPGSYGDLWSSTSYSYSFEYASMLYFDSENFYRYIKGRHVGQSVRPLREFDTVGVAFSTAATHLALDTRTGTRYAHAEEPIAFSTDWSEGVTRLVLTVDGVNVLSTTSATNGVYVWKPDLSTTRTVTLKHTTRGSVNEALTATFTTAAYDVTFAAGAHGALSGGVPTTQRVPHGEAAVAPEVVPTTGYRFTGWSADISCVTENITVTALYEAIPYAITYEDLHGATHVNPSTYTIEDGVTFSAPNSIPRRQFVRWEPASIAVGSTGAVAVRAVWETTPYVYVDAAKGNDAWDGSTAERAVKTLARAYALTEVGDAIVVAAGSYASVTAKGKAVTFRGVDGATIDGGGVNRCVTADDDVVFENFILQNGCDTEAGGGACGGTFERCTIRNCHSDWDGGGAYEAILRNCVIVGNTAENGWGGGAYGGTLVGCVVKDNVAGDMGGGVYAPGILLDTTFSGNSPEDMAGDEGKVTPGSSFVYAPSGNSVAYAVSYDWLLATGLAKTGDLTAGLGAKMAVAYGNGYTGWESYVAGLSPNDAMVKFLAAVTITDDKVCVSWTPDLNRNGMTRIYTVFGRTDLEKGDWETPVQPCHRFFKVEVAMPTGTFSEKSAVAGEGFVPKEKPLGGVQLWENGPYWAECNVGATKPEE